MQIDKERLLIVLLHIFSQFGYLFTLYLFSSDYKQLPWYDPDSYKYYLLTIFLPLPMFFSLLIGFNIKRKSTFEKYIQAIYPIGYLIAVAYMVNMGMFGMQHSSKNVSLIAFILYIPTVYFLYLDIKKFKDER